MGKAASEFFFFSKSQFQLNNCRQSLLFVRLFVPLPPPLIFCSLNWLAPFSSSSVTRHNAGLKVEFTLHLCIQASFFFLLLPGLQTELYFTPLHDFSPFFVLFVCFFSLPFALSRSIVFLGKKNASCFCELSWLTDVSSQRQLVRLFSGFHISSETLPCVSILVVTHLCVV